MSVLAFHPSFRITRVCIMNCWMNRVLLGWALCSIHLSNGGELVVVAKKKMKEEETTPIILLVERIRCGSQLIQQSRGIKLSDYGLMRRASWRRFRLQGQMIPWISCCWTVECQTMRDWLNQVESNYHLSFHNMHCWNARGAF